MKIITSKLYEQNNSKHFIMMINTFICSQYFCLFGNVLNKFYLHKYIELTVPNNTKKIGCFMRKNEGVMCFVIKL